MKLFLSSILCLFAIVCFSQSQTTNVIAATGIPDTSFGLTGIDTQFRRIEHKGYVYYLPGRWKDIPDVKPCDCPERNFVIHHSGTAKMVDSLKLLNHSLNLKNELLLKSNSSFKVKVNALQMLRHQANQKQISLSKIDNKLLYALSFLTFIWLLLPLYYEKHNRSNTHPD